MINYLFPPFDCHLRYFNSTDGGNTWNGPYQINDSADAKPPENGYDIAVDDGGKIHVVWSDLRDLGFESPQIYYSNSSHGVNWSINRNITSLQNTDMLSPGIEVGPNGQVHVIWMDGRLGNNDVYYCNSTDGGMSYSPEHTVNQVTVGTQQDPEMCISSTGELHFVWGDSRSGDQDIYYCNSSDYVHFPPGIRLNTVTQNDQRYPALSLSPRDAPFVAWQDGRLAPWRIYATGLAAPFKMEGSASGLFDLGLEPAVLSGLYGEHELGTGSSVSFAIRTSTDNFTWSDWESIILPGSPETTPSRRYIEWRVFLETDDSMITPVVRSFRLNYSFFKPNGQYVSSPRSMGSGQASYTLEWWCEYGGGNISGYISGDGGQNWTLVNGSNEIKFTCESVIYRLDIAGTSAFTPKIVCVKLNRTTEVYPTDLAVDFGDDGTDEWYEQDQFLTREILYFTNDLNAAVLSHPFPDELPYRLKFTSSTRGKLLMENISVVLNMYPAITDLTPTSNNLTISENETLEFSVNATDPDDIDLDYIWLLDGLAVSNMSRYSYTPSVGELGTHEIRVEVSDGYSSVNTSWTVRVIPGNRAPTIISRVPNDDLELEWGGNAAFSIAVLDLDNDTLDFQWSINGSPVGKNSNSLMLDTHSLEGPGNYTVAVTISDGLNSVSTSWIVNVILYKVELAIVPDELELVLGESGVVNITLSNLGSAPGLFEIVYFCDFIGNNNRTLVAIVELLPRETYGAKFNITAPMSAEPGSYQCYFSVISDKHPAGILNASFTLNIIKESDDKADGEEGGSGDIGFFSSIAFWSFVIILVVIILLVALFVIARKRGNVDEDKHISAVVDHARVTSQSESTTGSSGQDGSDLNPLLKTNGIIGTVLPPSPPDSPGVQPDPTPAMNAARLDAPTLPSAPDCPICPTCNTPSKYYPEYSCHWCETCRNYVQ